jgi:hypothetical protein
MTVAKKKPNYLFDGLRDGVYVRAWKEGRKSIIVQIWLTSPEEGDPSGDWDMPAVLGADAAIAQAIIQTRNRK